MKPRLQIGQVVATPQALDALQRAGQSPHEFLTRHAEGDWGAIRPEDKALNERALSSGERVISAYETNEEERIWIITEADRSSTTLLLPEEY